MSFPLSNLLDNTKQIYTKTTATETALTTMQNGVTTTGNGTILNVSGMGTAICHVSGTFIGTITFEGSLDNSTFSAIDAQNINGGLISSVAISTGFYKIPCNGIKYIRARVSAYTSGSITVKGYADALTCSNNAFQLTGSYQKKVILANAVAITDTVAHSYNLIANGGMTENEIRQYKNFQISFINSHDQAATIAVYQGNAALGAAVSTPSGTIYTESAVLNASTGRLILQSYAGGTGAHASNKTVPALTGIFCNLFIVVTFATAPTSGALTIAVEMN